MKPLHPRNKEKKNLELLKLICNEIKKRRAEKGLTQEELASRADLHSKYIGVLERTHNDLSISTLYRIFGALDMQPSAVLKNFESKLSK